MNRSALAVALALLPSLGGCMFFTPPTGVCVGEPCRTFEAQRTAQAQAAAAQAAAGPQGTQALQYKTTDFELVFPGIWGELALTQTDAEGKQTSVPLRDQSEPSGVSTLRIAVGGLLQLSDGATTSEGLRIITLNGVVAAADEASGRAALADITRRSVLQNFEGQPEIKEGEGAMLSGKPAYEIAMWGIGKGQTVSMRHTARAVLHRGRGYIMLVSTVQNRYTEATTATGPNAYDGLFEGLKLLDADPTYPVPTPGPTGSPGPSASPGASPAPAGSPGPSASPGPLASPGPAATPSASPRP